jgi:ribosomal protein S18 acetylase RimI-like enzyme
VKQDLWLSRVMNINCYNFTCSSIGEYLSFKRLNFDQKSFFVTLRTTKLPKYDLAEFDKTILFITAMNNYFWIPDKNFSISDNPFIKLYNIEDYKGVVDVANHSFTADRFHKDSRISKSLADRIKIEWLESNLLKCRETVTFVYISPFDKKVLGFNSLLINKDSIAIDLIAVSTEFRRKGVGTALINAGKKLAQDRGLRLTVGTQKDNLANSLYLKNGFILHDVLFVSHDTSII